MRPGQFNESTNDHWSVAIGFYFNDNSVGYCDRNDEFIQIESFGNSMGDHVKVIPQGVGPENPKITKMNDNTEGNHTMGKVSSQVSARNGADLNRSDSN